jgi:hypothetical protein
MEKKVKIICVNYCAASCHGRKTDAQTKRKGITAKGRKARVIKNKSTGKWCVYVGTLRKDAAKFRKSASKKTTRTRAKAIK